MFLFFDAENISRVKISMLRGTDEIFLTTKISRSMVHDMYMYTCTCRCTCTCTCMCTRTCTVNAVIETKQPPHVHLIFSFFRRNHELPQAGLEHVHVHVHVQYINMNIIIHMHMYMYKYMYFLGVVALLCLVSRTDCLVCTCTCSHSCA